MSFEVLTSDRLLWLSSNDACDIQTPVNEIEVCLFITDIPFIDTFYYIKPFDNAVVPDEQTIIAISFGPSTFTGLWIKRELINSL